MLLGNGGMGALLADVAFAALPAHAQQTLTREMAYSGAPGEAYDTSPTTRGGPAFLVYYSPAFVRCHGLTQHSARTLTALRALFSLWRVPKRPVH